MTDDRLGLGDTAVSVLDAAIAARAPMVDAAHETAFRLFNGFTEGLPALTLDVYQRCLVLHDYAPGGDAALTARALAAARARLPWLTSAVLKRRDGTAAERTGHLIFGAPDDLPSKVLENGVWYSLRLMHHQDASLYLDTRNLRAWAKAHLRGKRVFNTFAYTGSLGVAARAAPSGQVITTDANQSFLAIAAASFALNGLAVPARDFIRGDFFTVVARLKREQQLFDCVFVDPPFFSKGDRGVVDLQSSMGSLINKVRPLVGHEGALVVVNNAVFVSGAELKALLDALCADGYLALETLVDVPPDCAGYLVVGTPPTDPAPFNHSTKIAILRATRKDGRRAGDDPPSRAPRRARRRR
jgi:23S rRNA (cytosine1962-C5)-methyltransferase